MAPPSGGCPHETLTDSAPRPVWALVATCVALGVSASDGSLHEWRFAVSLDGKPIGEHRFVLRQRDELRELTSEAKFRVRFLFINAYHYEHSARELWRGDCLERLDARTDDNGNETVVSGERDGGGFRVTHRTGHAAGIEPLRADLRILESEHPRRDASAQSADRRVPAGAGARPGTREVSATARTRSATACSATPAASRCTSTSGTPRRASGWRSNRSRPTVAVCATRGSSDMHLRIPLRCITMGMLTMLGGCRSSRPPITTAPRSSSRGSWVTGT